MRRSYFLLVILLFTGCGGTLPASQTLAQAESVLNSTPTIEPSPEATPETPYEGKNIADVFPVVGAFSSLRNGDVDKGTHEVSMEGYVLKIDEFRPLVLQRNKQIVFSFHTHYKEDYWALATGVAHLIGPNSSEIYVENTGPGGVCCTNYWIVDISPGPPRLIFSSEEWGSFRDVIEIFDSDNDGINELAHFDSCFRYIFDDCGTCTPEPRVAWRYDARAKQYLPEPNLMQAFAQTEFDQEIASLKDKSGSPGQTDAEQAMDARRTSLDVFAQLMHLGKEKEAWKILNRYFKPSTKERSEINQRLVACPYYQFIHLHRHT